MEQTFQLGHLDYSRGRRVSAQARIRLQCIRCFKNEVKKLSEEITANYVKFSAPNNLLVKRGYFFKQHAELVQYGNLQRWFSDVKELRVSKQKFLKALRSTSLLDREM